MTDVKPYMAFDIYLKVKYLHGRFILRRIPLYSALESFTLM